MRVFYEKVILSPHSQSALLLLIAAGLQAVRFFLLARGLGATVFGQLMILQAIAELAIGVVSLGAGEVLIRQVSRQPSLYATAMGHALILTFSTGLVLSIAIAPVALFFDLPLSAAAIGMFFLGELLGGRLAGLSEHAFLAFNRTMEANIVKLIFASVRLCSVCIGIYGLGFVDLFDWLIIQSVVTLMSGLTCLLLALWALGLPKFSFNSDEIPFGAHIAITLLTLSVQSTMDRVVLGIVASPATVAIYSSARRAIELAEIPIQALLRNLFPQFFKVGIDGVSSAIRLARANMSRLVVTSVLSSAIVFGGADLIDRLLGPGFEGAALMLRWLSPVIVLRASQFILSDILTASGHQKWRTLIGIVAAVAYISIIGVLTPIFGTSGLLAGIYLSYLAAVLMTCVVLWRAQRQESLYSR